MAKIDFRNKINWRRRFRSPPRVETERDILRIFESDRGRIVNSPAIRRLQQKTQVFPLERRGRGGIVVCEEDQLDWLETQRDLITRIGLENWLQAQIED